MSGTLEQDLAQATALVEQLRGADEEGRDKLRQALLVLAEGDNGTRVRERIDDMRKGELLEVQWEIEEVLDATAPKKPEPETPPEPEPEPEEPVEDDPNKPLTSADLNLVYDDPRGLMLHKSKKGERWFATQVDPYTGQPKTFELHPSEVGQIKTQLEGSPYWLVGG